MARFSFPPSQRWTATGDSPGAGPRMVRQSRMFAGWRRTAEVEVFLRARCSAWQSQARRQPIPTMVRMSESTDWMKSTTLTSWDAGRLRVDVVGRRRSGSAKRIPGPTRSGRRTIARLRRRRGAKLAWRRPLRVSVLYQGKPSRTSRSHRTRVRPRMTEARSYRSLLAVNHEGSDTSACPAKTLRPG